MKQKKRLICAMTITAAFAGLYVFGSDRVPPLYTINTEITLPASPEKSWNVLTDFAGYPDWNPYLPRVEATFAAGESVSFTLVDENFPDPLNLTAQLGQISANRSFYWTGRLGVQGLFDTRHVFELHPRDDGNTELHHYEEFRGLIPALLPQRKKRTGYTRAAFERMNSALYQRLKESAG
ncbi:MAG: SRPBCC family protein [Halioglobus sp.]